MATSLMLIFAKWILRVKTERYPKELMSTKAIKVRDLIL